MSYFYFTIITQDSPTWSPFLMEKQSARKKKCVPFMRFRSLSPDIKYESYKVQ